MALSTFNKIKYYKYCMKIIPFLKKPQNAEIAEGAVYEICPFWCFNLRLLSSDLV
jgi:hypothetical protein